MIQHYYSSAQPFEPSDAISTSSYNGRQIILPVTSKQNRGLFKAPPFELDNTDMRIKREPIDWSKFDWEKIAWRTLALLGAASAAYGAVLVL